MASASPLVGRDSERDQLRVALRELACGAGGVLLLRGEVGTGKSRLLGEVLAGDTTVRLEAGPGVGPGALPRVRRLLVEAGDRFGSGPWVRALQLLDHPSAAADPAPGELERVLVEALVATSDDVPVLMVVEDLHQAGEDELAVLGFVSERAGERPLLLLGTYDGVGLARDHGLRRLRARAARSRFREIELGPLGADESAQLVAALAPGVDAAVVDEIRRLSGGVPFFVEELSRSVGDQAVGAVLPESVTDAVLEGTRALRDACGEAVDLAAVLGESVPAALLVDLVGDDDVGRLVDSGLLVGQVEGDRTEELAFRHPLVRRALCAAIPWSRRRQLHRRVAEAGEARGVAPEVSAAHWEAAGVPSRARPLLVAAARSRCDVHAYRDAAAFARRALAAWPAGEEPAERAQVLTGLADCADKSQEPRAAASLWAEVALARRDLGDRLGAALATRSEANAAGLAGDRARAESSRAAAAEAFAAAGDRAAAVGERLALAEQLRSRGRLRGALDQLELARREVEDADSDTLTARVLTAEGAARSAQGEGDRGVALARAGLELALASGDLEVAGATYYEFAEALLYATDYVGSADAYAMAADFCAEQGISELGQACRACMSVAERFHGDWERALEICRGVLGDPGSTTVVRTIAEEESALIWALRGAHGRARPQLRRTLRAGEEHGVFGVEIGSLWGLAAAAAAAGETQATRDAVGDLLQRCESVDDWNFALPALRWSASWLGQQGDHAVLARVQQMLGRAATQNAAPKTLSVLAHAGAEMSLLEDPDLASGQFARSVELLGPGGARYEWALATWRWGVALVGSGDHAAALARLGEAQRTARRLGARPLAAACTDQLLAVTSAAGRPSTAHAGLLSPREQEVLVQLAAGRTNRAIAADLVVSVRTVDMHVRNILQKLDCPSRTAAGRRAVDLGLVPSAAD